MSINDFRDFLDNFLLKLKKTGIDYSNLFLDHVGYQTSSSEDYESIKKEIGLSAKFIYENLVGGRRVSLCKLHHPLRHLNYEISALEVIEPKAGQICPSAFEHGEFVIKEHFDLFMKKYPGLKWDTSAVNQPLFPLLKLPLDKNIQVKFHHQPLL